MEDRNSMKKFFSYSIKLILFSVKDLAVTLVQWLFVHWL